MYVLLINARSLYYMNSCINLLFCCLILIISCFLPCMVNKDYQNRHQVQVAVRINLHSELVNLNIAYVSLALSIYRCPTISPNPKSAVAVK